MSQHLIKILIVDDNPSFVSNFSNLIKNVVGDKLESLDLAYSGEEGLAFLSSDTYDFIFVDIDMPGIGGIEMTRIFDKENYRKTTRIVAISFHNEFEYYTQMIMAGATNFLVKDEIDFNSLTKLFYKIQ